MFSVVRSVIATSATRSFVTRVRTGEVRAVETLGKFSKVLEPGLHFRVPIIQKFTPKRSTLVDDEVFVVRCKTKDGAFADVSGLVTCKLVDLEAREYGIEEFNIVMIARIANVIRTQASRCDLDELYNQEQSLTMSIEDDLSTWAEPFGVAIRSASIIDVAPDQEVLDAMNSVIIASREREATLHAAKAERAEIVARADADKVRQIKLGEGMSGKRLAIMDGYKKSVDDFSNATGISPDLAASISLATEYMDMLRGMARDGRNVIFTPYSPSGADDIVEAVRTGVMQADAGLAPSVLGGLEKEPAKSDSVEKPTTDTLFTIHHNPL